MKPSIGRIVHYVVEKPAAYQPKDGPRFRAHLPAIITAVWGDTCVNLQVFTDGTNSHSNGTMGVVWETSRTMDETMDPQIGTWHWPEREGA